MRRREFISFLGSAATFWPFVACAQQPVIGFLGAAAPEEYEIRLRSFREGLKSAGYFEGQNVTVNYRWAQGHNEQLPALAAELARSQIAVLVAGGGTAAAVAAKAATSTIPVVFAVAVDPVSVGLVPSLNRPGGNLTGVTNLNADMGPKRLELLRQLIPKATTVALLINPTNPTLAEPYTQLTKEAASSLGLQLHILQASNDKEIETAFSNLIELHADAVLVAPDVFFNTRNEELAALSLRHKMPTIYHYRPFPAAGGLVSYGSDEKEYYNLVGAYTGRILKGDKPADLPIQRSTKVELIINLKTAKALGITVPLDLIGRADEIIE
jgi:putative ABC transport system substrate-binding protein